MFTPINASLTSSGANRIASVPTKNGSPTVNKANNIKLIGDVLLTFLQLINEMNDPSTMTRETRKKIGPL